MIRRFVGIDGSTTDYKVCTTNESGEVLDEITVLHKGAALEALVNRLRTLSQQEPEAVAVGIEVPRGAIVETLLEAGFQVFAINPKQLDRFRDRFSVAGAKDDRRDALVLASALRTDRGCYRQLQVDDPEIIELRELSRIDGELRDDTVRLTNQLTDQLRRYFPQFLELGTLDQPWLWELLELVPTPAKARGAARTITPLLKKYRIRRFTSRQVRAILKAKPLRLAPGAAEAAASHVEFLIPRLRLAHRQRRESLSRIEKLLEGLGSESKGEGGRGEHRDVDVLLSLPGLGTRVAATMLSEAPEAIQKRSYNTLRVYGGQAPVTKASGKSSQVRMRRACNPRLRDAIHHWTRVSTMHDPYAKAHYKRLRTAGHSNGRALRGVADRQLKMVCAMLTEGSLYDPSRRHAATETTETT